jgi:hypothetical protein
MTYRVDKMENRKKMTRRNKSGIGQGKSTPKLGLSRAKTNGAEASPATPGTRTRLLDALNSVLSQRGIVLEFRDGDV